VGRFSTEEVKWRQMEGTRIHYKRALHMKEFLPINWYYISEMVNTKDRKIVFILKLLDAHLNI
jgi:hypothetical protein